MRYSWNHGRRVELIGKEDLSGTEAYKLKITLVNGDQIHKYLDAESYLELKQTSKMTRGEQVLESETTLSDYKQVGALTMPHLVQSALKGTTMSQTIAMKKIELNVKLDDSHFAMPQPAAAAK